MMDDKAQRGWTWERLRAFFAGGGEIRLPTDEELIADCRDPLRLSKLEAEGVNEFRLLFEDPPRFKGLRYRYPLPEVEWRDLAMTPEDRAFARIREALEDCIPIEMGMDLARGPSETWLMTWDAAAGKIIYRKIEPGEMYRGDD